MVRLWSKGIAARGGRKSVSVCRNSKEHTVRNDGGGVTMRLFLVG